ncbi:unnamed protein product [Vitrella brassicaformis CCMP3155]|uniref:Uncharacterized protein n=1 Tax=Vitrella brassicaformis (strain CCMP3155) TaxID=1169540 RepID=A0A0G4FRQ8_VITBC|nr:unnamed protein product [Vitrella brassicaformis CCMP3155]|eukprot:CEM17344.1 unnamed protein product [Vitrella brassicaformis CCMP3155]
MLSKKRKAEGDAAAAAAGESTAGQQDEYDQQPPFPRIGRRIMDQSVHKAIAALLAIENAARTARQQLQTKAEAIKELIESTGGKLELTGGIEGEVKLSVGGRVVGVSRKGLMLEQLRHTYFAHLLLYGADALPRDQKGRPFLDADPNYADWLCDEIAIAEGKEAQGQEHQIKLDDTQKKDPSFAFYHKLFLTHTPLDIDAPSEDIDMDDGDKEGNKEGEGQAGVMDKIREYVEGYDAAVAELEGAAGHLKDFGKAMEPFIRAEDGSAHEVKTVTVLGKKVSTTEATLSQLGPDSTLYKRFSGEIVHGGVPIRQTSSENFMKVVDFARRQRLEKRRGHTAKAPIARDMKQLKVDMEMFGFKMQPPC